MIDVTFSVANKISIKDNIFIFPVVLLMWTSSFRGEKVKSNKDIYFFLNSIISIPWWKSKLSVFLSPPSVCTILYFPEMRDSYFHDILKTADNEFYFIELTFCWRRLLLHDRVGWTFCYLFDFSLIFLKRSLNESIWHDVLMTWRYCVFDTL